jgi:hypothetical protein
MGTYSSSAAGISPPRKRISGRRVRLRGQDGQSLIIVTLAMFVVLGISATAIDLAQWYQRHHQAQLAADAAALAAANCLNRQSVGCTSATDTLGANNVATIYARTNAIPTTSGSSVTSAVNTTAASVTVSTTTPGSVFLAGVVGVSASVSARAVASYDAPGTVPYSLFAGNSTCGTNLGIYFDSGGNGNADVQGIHSNGTLVLNGHSNHTVSGTVTYTAGPPPAPVCQSANDYSTSSSSDVITSSGTTALAYPEIPSTPSCPVANQATDFWSTDKANAEGKKIAPSGGVYCIVPSIGTGSTSTFVTNASCPNTSGNNSSWDGQTDTIYIGSNVSGDEFVGPCNQLDASGMMTGYTPSPAPTTPNPLIYGTLNTTSSNGGTTDTWVTLGGNNQTLNAPYIYDPTGTVEVSGNSQTMTSFFEAYNVHVDKNSLTTLTGNSTVLTNGGDALTQ